MTKTQVALGHTAGLLRVILKVGLRILIGIVADDLDGVFVGAYRAVRAETPELAGDDRLAGGDDILAHGQGQMGYIVVDADGEMISLFARHIIKHGLNVRRNGILGAEAVASAEDLHGGKAALAQGGADVLIQRLARSAGLLGAVEHGDALDRLGQRRDQMPGREGTVEVHLHHTDLFAARVEVVDDLHRGLTDGAHCDDDALGVRRAVVVKELIIAPGERVDFVHLLLHDLRQRIVGRVAGLTGLEEGVGILQR